MSKREEVIRVFKVDTAKGSRIEEVVVPGDTSRNLRVGVVCLNPGEKVGEHSTGNHEEVLLIVKGEAHLLSGSNEFVLRKDSIGFVPQHTPHDVENKGDEQLLYIYVVSRLHENPRKTS